MKNLILTLTITLGTLMMSHGAKADQPSHDIQLQTVSQAVLTNVKLNKKHIEWNEVKNVEIYINHTREYVHMTINYISPCPPAAPGEVSCLALAIPPTVIELPLVKTVKNSNGRVVYTAMKDDRIADGLLQVLRIVDDSGRIDAIVDVEDMTRFTYTTKSAGMNGKPKTYKSRGAGPFLETFIRY